MILEVNVEKGMEHNQKIVFVGECDQAVRLLAPMPAPQTSRHVAHTLLPPEPDSLACTLSRAAFSIAPARLDGAPTVCGHWRTALLGVQSSLRKPWLKRAWSADGATQSASQPDTVPGDIIFVIQQKEHAVFKRVGAPPSSPALDGSCKLLVAASGGMGRMHACVRARCGQTPDRG